MEADLPGNARLHRGVRAAALLLVTFLAGTVAGFAPTYFRREAALGGVASPYDMRLRVGNDLPPAFEELGLTPTQRSALVQILVRARPRTDAVLADVLPRLRAITDSVDTAMRAVLRPEQRERLSHLRGTRGPMLLLRRPSPGGGAPHVDTIAPGLRSQER